MNYLQQLEHKAKEFNSIVCMGIDPIIEKIPLQGKPAEVILKFFLEIMEAMNSEGIFPAAVKPNLAFFEQYGLEALQALKQIIEAYQSIGVHVIMDCKRGDIRKTSAAYAKAMFDFWQVDAVTVAPYLGYDSVQPFLDYCKKGKGVYVLCRTSNPGARDFQDLPIGGTPLYRKVAERLIDWHQPGLGAVLGATYPTELEQLSTFFVQSGKKVPFLIPGIGGQGGSAEETIQILKKTNNNLLLHRINSSSGILYAYEKENTEDFAGSAVKEIKRLNAVLQ